jgi:polyisoprenoid-binding protein YceI
MEYPGRTKWAIDTAHSEISFKVKYLMITNIKGTFKDFSASVYTTDNNFITSDIDFSLITESVDTGMADRDVHLKSHDFFDSENHRNISFTGKNIEKAGSDKYKLVGDLTIKDITREVKLDVEFAGLMKDPWGNEKAGYTIEGKINRKDWDLNWNAALEAGGFLLSDDVKILCEVQLVKQDVTQKKEKPVLQETDIQDDLETEDSDEIE